LAYKYYEAKGVTAVKVDRSVTNDTVTLRGRMKARALATSASNANAPTSATATATVKDHVECTLTFRGNKIVEYDCECRHQIPIATITHNADADTAQRNGHDTGTATPAQYTNSSTLNVNAVASDRSADGLDKTAASVRSNVSHEGRPCIHVAALLMQQQHRQRTGKQSDLPVNELINDLTTDDNDERIASKLLYISPNRPLSIAQKAERQYQRQVANKLTVAQLKSILKMNNLVTSGIKSELVERYADGYVRGELYYRFLELLHAFIQR
jgi:hypothetical protein